MLFELAERLGWPTVSPIKRIVQVEEGALVVDRITEEGSRRVRVELPALIGVSSEANQPRYPALKGVLIAKRAEIPTWRRADLGLGDPEPRVAVRRLYVESREARTEFVAGDSPAAIGAKLAERMREAGLL